MTAGNGKSRNDGPITIKYFTLADNGKDTIEHNRIPANVAGVRVIINGNGKSMDYNFNRLQGKDDLAMQLMAAGWTKYVVQRARNNQGEGTPNEVASAVSSIFEQFDSGTLYSARERADKKPRQGAVFDRAGMAKPVLAWVTKKLIAEGQTPSKALTDKYVEGVLNKLASVSPAKRKSLISQWRKLYLDFNAAMIEYDAEQAKKKSGGAPKLRMADEFEAMMKVQPKSKASASALTA